MRNTNKVKRNGTKLLFSMMIAFLLFAVAFGVFALSGCNEKASKYTEEEHIQRVTERIEERFMTDEFEYTGFEVYPLYDENDDLKYFLVEFEPYEFMYVLLRDEQLKAFSFLGASTSMYKLSTFEVEWSRYTIDQTDSKPYSDGNKIWEIDENGEKIIRNKSPFSEAGVEEIRKYLLRDSKNRTDYVPAVKTGDNYKNLISMDEVTIIDGSYTKKQATVHISFIAKKRFDL